MAFPFFVNCIVHLPFSFFIEGYGKMLPALSRLSVIYQRSQSAFLQRFFNTGSKTSLPKNQNIQSFPGKNAWEVDTNVAKDVVLYSYENSKFHTYLNLFAITQLGFWLYLAEFSMSTLRDVPVNKKELDPNAHWYQKINLGENKFRRGITTMCVGVGKAWNFKIWYLLISFM